MKGAELEPTSNSLPANREEAGELITPEQADQWEVSALQAIEDVQDPDQADELLKRITLAEQAIKLSKLSGDYYRRWRGVHLRAERRYGELLPKPKPGAPVGSRNAAKKPITDGSRPITENKPSSGGINSKAEELARRKARQVAGVSKKEFEEYVSENKNPTRAGLMREEQEKKRRKEQEEKRQATRNAMAPGQWLKDDEPKAPAKTFTWRDRLWNAIPTGKGFRQIADELELDPDPATLSDDDITRLIKLLQEQINERQRLKKVLSNIKEARRS
jgi:hypothetical protein